ncbi:disease resistance protein At4g27190-like isoform X2 [Carya illinoinensis]|uniref:disease resistance protein At4g27190-like isoform X2 n=1 Tax=Carya illinoinensis TaxID=32201 RepID=UPI001C71C16B|nr:disease resistance protein At4g27190-like isoform X2 [Carya illinoinensis]
MAESIAISIAAKIAEYTVKPIGRWLCYSCHYNSNIENLKKQKEKLQDARESVQHSVLAASRNGEKIYSDVSKWLTNVDRITELATEKLRESEEEAGTRSSNAACLNLKQRHQLSREAKKMVGDIAELFAELHNNGNFEKVSHPTLPSEAMVMTTTDMDYMAMDSRMTAVKGIMEALGNTDIDKIGVWGMPGVGKSTLMKEIARQAREEKLFDEVVMAVVTDNPDVRRIQGKIACTLGLNFDQEFEEGRANQLKQRLSKDKKILVILDDIWKELDLQEIGIPSEGCKVVMTSRDRDVLICKMGARKEIELKILQEAEACNLIEKMAGDSFKDQPEVRAIATEIAKKCTGLPIALVTVSKALKNKRLSEWKDTLRRLKSPAPEHITEMLKTIYTPIEVSYDSLESQELKSLFLLCAQLPYFLDYRDLLKYSYGYGLCHGINTLEDARDTLDTLLRKLKDSCLLLESSEEFYMHDLVRDVAIIIASKNHNMFVMRDDGGQKAWPDVDALNRCEALSIHGEEIHEHPNKMECPKLRFFHVNCKDSRNLKISDIFFQGMDKLEVLSLRRMRLSSLFPLTNLQTLCLDGCGLGDIHWIGELKTLVILSLAYSAISNLPREIESLTRLRLLDLTRCYKLRVIAPNVLSSLVNLEELYMQGIKVQWEVEGPGNEGKNASLAELKKLSQLTTLEIDIPNANNLPANLFHEKLKRYKICIGDEIYNLVFTREAAFSRVLKLNLNMSFQLDFGIKMLLKGTEYLSLDEANRTKSRTKSVLYEVDREDFQQLKHLHIQNNGNIKHSPELGTSDVAFPTLEAFVLKNMFNLEEICQGKLPLSSFKNLKVLKVENCDKLRFIFSSSIARGLSLLEELNITRCNNIGAIFVKEEEDGIEDQGDMMLFGRLQTLLLNDLPKLVGFLSTKDSFMADCRETNSEGNHDLQLPLLHHDQLSFPSLKMLHIREMDKLEIIWQDQVTATSFPNIQELTIFGCDKLLHVFQSNLHTTTTTLMQSLTRLDISFCSSLETIFGNMEGQNGKEPQVLIAPSSGMEESVAREDGIARHIEFPVLTQLLLYELPKLKWIFEGVHTNWESWPSLKELCLRKCGEQVNKMIWASKFASSSSSEENQLLTCIQQPMFVVEEGTFPNLEDLSLFFSGTICPSRFSDFPDPSFLLTRLPNLLKLNVYDSVCEEIFPYELVDREIRLRRLTLCRLCMVTHLWKEDNTKPCPLFHNLEYLDVSRCSKLKNIVPSSVSLHNLTGLKISDCHGLINLLTSSTAKTLVQLKRMTVIDCKRITEIVAMEDVGEANVAITFNKLRCLELRRLPNLTHFCSGPYSFGFPSLDEVIVRCCPEMKTFSHGVLSTPKLKGVSDDYMSFFSKPNLYWEDDLNTTTRCLWEKSNQYDTGLLFRERVENSEEDEDHP